jgi:hypothetical protein
MFNEREGGGDAGRPVAAYHNVLIKVNIKQARNRPGVAQTVPGS